jgi:carboxymethylenebutenolidase
LGQQQEVGRSLALGPGLVAALAEADWDRVAWTLHPRLFLRDLIPGKFNVACVSVGTSLGPLLAKDEEELSMCHEPASRPPLPPESGAARGGRRLVLEASDGNRFVAFGATTDIVDAPGVVILPDVRGLHPFYEDLALRFSYAGVHALAVDYYGRTAGTGTRGDDFDHEPHFEQATDDGVDTDIASALDYVRSPRGGRARAVFTVGFCFGGRISFNQAASRRDLAGVVGFYGRVAAEEPGDPSAPVVQAPSYRCPVLGLFGGADPSITAEHVEAFRRALVASGVRHEIVTYEGAPHSFFDRRFTNHAKASRDAWARVLAFMREGSH